MQRLTELLIHIEVVEHKDTHLLVARSEDLKGLYVAARSTSQLEQEIPLAIQEMLEAQGYKGVTVEACHDQTPESFISRRLTAHARMEEFA